MREEDPRDVGEKQQQAFFFYSGPWRLLRFFGSFCDCSQRPQTSKRLGCCRELLYAETSCFKIQRRWM